MRRAGGEALPRGQDSAGGAWIVAGLAQIPSIAQRRLVFRPASEAHGSGGAFERQPLAPGAGPGRLRAGELSREASAAPALKAASASCGAPPASSAQPGTVGGAAADLAVAGSRRIMCLEGKAAVRFVPSFSHQNAQLVGATKRMIMLPYQLFSCAGVTSYR